MTAPRPARAAGDPERVWLLPLNAAVQLYDCDAQLCGRIVWMQRPRNPQGELVIDRKNPDPTLRARPLCGLKVLWGMTPAGADHWKDGWIYNPNDGHTYRINGELKSPDVFVARIYVGIPLFGKTSTWLRVPQLTSEGWC